MSKICAVPFTFKRFWREWLRLFFDSSDGQVAQCTQVFAIFSIIFSRQHSRIALISVALLGLGACSAALTSSVQDKGQVTNYFLPKSNIKMDLLSDGAEYQLQYIETQIVPDRDFEYALYYRYSAFSDDKYVIQRTNTGLLSSIQFTADEKTAEVLVKVVDIAKEVAKAAFVPFADLKEQGFETVYSGVFDPFNPEERQAFVDAINEISGSTGLKYNIEIDQKSYEQDPGAPDRPKSAPYSSCTAGACFRTASIFPLIITRGKKEVQRINLTLPNPAAIGSVDITRAAFVKKVTDITFDNGILTKIDVHKPSEALAFMEIPLSIAKAIVSVPGEILKLKFDISTAEKNLLDAQKNELKAKQELIDFQRELLKKEAEGSADDPLS